MLVTWPDGVEEGPGGHMLREVPGGEWDDQTWVSEDGRVFQRAYDPLGEAWAWSKARQVHMDADDALTVDLFAGSRRRRVRLARAIALAWLHCPDRSAAHAIVFGGAIEARGVRWQAAGTLAVDGAPNGEWAEADCPADDGRWAPLAYAWTNANGDTVERVRRDGLYRIHPSGWVRSHLCDRASMGHMTPDGHRWVAIQGSGLVRVDAAVAHTFGGRVPPPAVRLTPSLLAILEAVRAQQSAAEICLARAILASTLWSQLCTLARAAAWEDARLLWALCPRDVRECLREGGAAEEHGVKALLLDVRARVGATCPILHASDADAYGMLRVGWALVRRERLRARVA